MISIYCPAKNYLLSIAVALSPKCAKRTRNPILEFQVLCHLKRCVKQIFSLLSIKTGSLLAGSCSCHLLLLSFDHLANHFAAHGAGFLGSDIAIVALL